MFDNAPTDPGQVRHRCRNPRCGGTLEIPTTNRRDAFCCKGCDRAFYHSRCRVCESLFTRKTERRLVCWRSRCRHEFQRHPERFFGARNTLPLLAILGQNASRNPLKTGIKSDPKSGRALRHVAGPEAHEINYRIPLDAPASKANRAHWLEAERRAAGHALITRDTPPVNIIGGYRFPDAPAVDLRPTATTTKARTIPVSDGLAIPSFLKREA
jgi:hypothetical protein